MTDCDHGYTGDERTNCGCPSCDSRPGRTVEIDALDGEWVATAEDGTRVVLRGVWDHVEAWCQGDASHFRPDGGCAHLDELLTAQRPERDVHPIRFGGDRV